MTISDQNNAANSTYSLSSNAVGRSGSAQISYVGMQAVTLNGGMGKDIFQVISLPGAAFTLQGGSGTNTLSYSNYPGNVLVDLLLGYATGFSGISHIKNVTGSIFNSLLVGDSNNNTLIGGDYRNILIGEGGDNILNASAASSDNILIGGSNAYDTNLAALNAIFAEWNRTDLSFADRMSDLTTGTNSMGAMPLNVVSGQLLLLTKSTVSANNTPDILTGTTQTNPLTLQRAHNWFFYDTEDRLVSYLSTSDHKTIIS